MRENCMISGCVTQLDSNFETVNQSREISDSELAYQYSLTLPNTMLKLKFKNYTKVCLTYSSKTYRSFTRCSHNWNDRNGMYSQH